MHFSTYILCLGIVLILGLLAYTLSKDVAVLDNHLLYIQSHCTLPTR